MKWKFFLMNLFLLVFNKFYFKNETLKRVILINILCNIADIQVSFKNNIKIFLFLSSLKLNSVIFKKINEKNYKLLENIPQIINLIYIVDILIYFITLYLIEFLDFI